MKIPFLSTPDHALETSTQRFLPIADITDDIVIYKDGGAALIMSSTSLNFGLLSEREQQAVIAAYAGLLNSFNFPVQIVVRSQTKDVSSYMDYLEEHQKKLQNQQLSDIMTDYKNFILEAIKKKNVLSKRFYVIVLFTPYELGITKSLKTQLPIPGRDKEAPLPFPKSYVIRKARIALYPKRDHLIRQAQRLGIQFKHLNNNELIKLFYDIYNPEKPIKDMKMFETVEKKKK